MGVIDKAAVRGTRCRQVISESKNNNGRINLKSKERGEGGAKEVASWKLFLDMHTSGGSLERGKGERGGGSRDS